MGEALADIVTRARTELPPLPWLRTTPAFTRPPHPAPPPTTQTSHENQITPHRRPRPARRGRTLHAEPLKIAYSDWPGFTILEVAKQKGWFKEAGVDVELVWFDYLPSLDAFAAGKVDAVTVVATDALVNGANGAKSKFIACSITAMAAT